MSSLSDSSGNQISNNDSNPSLVYDVYLSFCDKDIGTKSFAPHLYTHLTVSGFIVFKDDDRHRNEDRLTPSVLHAIEGSRISIIVFSKRYFDSAWCLQELEKIMECYRTIGQMVVPVFYEVDSSYVSHHVGVLGEAFKHILMSGVTNISGFSVDSGNRNISKDIQNVVQHASGLLDKTYLFVADHPVGIESRVEEVIQLLNIEQSKHTLLVGIYGLGGVGKSTLAKAIYNLVGCSFEATSFLLNVRHNSRVSLQRQLLSDIVKTTNMELNTSGLENILKEKLLKKRIFLVLDDVSHLNQFYDLCGSRDSFGPGSRIIITSRREEILLELDADSCLRLELMNRFDSLELFSWHAFKQPSPVDHFVSFSIDAALCTKGLPLNVQIFGSLMSTKRMETEVWNSVLSKLKNDDMKFENVLPILRMSFDYLVDEVKKIFLDIVLNLIGMDLDDVIQLLKDSDYSAENGINILNQQNLVTIDNKNRIGMHDLVQDIGREIVRGTTSMTEERMYDVFLSFSGEDSRAKFISHLYTSLQIAGIYVFRDDDEIPRGDRISLSLLEAIRQSKISIVVLSGHYASSRWCMLELETIMEVGRARGLVIVPVFYEVDPSEVRHQEGKFGEGFKGLVSRISDDERKRSWETTFLEVGGIAGVVVINSRNESEDIKKIVEAVTYLLDTTDLFVADHPVGVESRVQHVIQHLNHQQSRDPLIVGIWGMAGIGKTTIAKASYNEIRRDFEAKGFLFNVREVWEQENGKVSLQQRLLSDIYKTTKIKIDSVDSGKMILKERLSQKRIFLVLDDVNKLDQLNALCGSRKWFGQGSIIIITTKDEDLLKSLEVDHVCRLNTMDDDESLELFSWHAFKQPSPTEGFTDISRDVVKYSGGLPLALQVIGSFLSTRKRKTEWKSVLEKLKLIPDKEVVEKLRISFDGLRDDDMKEIFLHIAFFFIGMDQDDVIQILKHCGHYAEIGISVLVQQSLVTVDRKNKIGVHDLLRDMGREIVRKKSTEGGNEPSRLWRYEDVHHVLSKNTRTTDVKGLSLKMESTAYLETKAFEKMDKLILLQLTGVQLDGDYKYLSREIRWLCWHGFPLKYTPADFHQGSLVALELKYSNLERVWKKSQLLKELKILNLSHSHNLRQTPDFSNLPNLEKLILKDCPSLSSVSTNIGQLNKLLLINLKDCKGLRELPRSIYKLESVKTLILSGCTNIDKLEEDIEQMKSLTVLVADKTGITKVPFAIVSLERIGYISLCGCEGFARTVLPSIIQSWICPTNNHLSFVHTFAGTPSLEFLDEQSNSFYGLPSAFKDLQNLPRLWLKCDSEAQLNQTMESILENFNTKGSEELEIMHSTPETSSINCHSQVQISCSQNSLASSLLIQMGENCHGTNTLRENILQKMPLVGSGLLPSDIHPDWLTFNGNGSSVTFEVPQVDGCSLKTIMCILYFSSPDDVASEGLKVFLVVNCTKKTILVCKRDSLLDSSDEEWQRLVSSTEPGDKVKFMVGFGNRFKVMKTTVYLIYDEPIDGKTKHCDEPDKNVIVSSGAENRAKVTPSTAASREDSTNMPTAEQAQQVQDDNPPRADSPLILETTQQPTPHRVSPLRALALNITDEEVAKYFSSPDPFQTVSSPVSNHLERVEAALIGEIPTDKAHVAALRASLFMLASSAEISSSEREAFKQIALQLTDVAYAYNRAKESYDSASHDLSRLRDLQDKKYQFQTSYFAMEEERQVTFARNEEINSRLTELSNQMDAIKKEMDSLIPEAAQLTTKIESFSEQRVRLYNEATSLDQEVVVLLSQKVGLERDLSSGRDGLAAANRTWDSFRRQVEKAKKPTAEGWTKTSQAPSMVEGTPTELLIQQAEMSTEPLTAPTAEDPLSNAVEASRDQEFVEQI